MAQNSSMKESIPSIATETLEKAVQDLTSQYANGLDTGEVIPKALYLNELPSYNEFFAKFLVPNQLCVLTETATRQWRSRQEWVCQDGSPNFHLLRKAFGNATVPVADCKNREFSAHPKQEMKMGEFLTYWQQYREAGHHATHDSLYLKDWHFTRAFPDYKAYTTCTYFQSDWMNEFWDVREDIDDDYRFVYMGPKNTWTPFHADVFRSFSWSANICGRKRWIFFPPGEEEHLKDCHGGLVYDVTSKELEDPHQFPSAHNIQNRIEIIQQPGETIFVPSGWHHQVENLEDTISINHNWLNGCNVRHCWNHLKASLADVEQEISDCRDMEGWHQQCQTILRALTGLDYEEFFCFMESVARRRIQALTVWKRKSDNLVSCCITCSTPQCDVDVKSLTLHPSEDRNSGIEELHRTSAESCQVVEEVLDLSEGLELNALSSDRLHWSSCNMNHALFDLASVAMVLRDMKLHMSSESTSRVEQHVSDKLESDSYKSRCDSHAKTVSYDVNREGKDCPKQNTNDKCLEKGDSQTEKSCRVESLLLDIADTLSAFGVKGSWDL